MPPTTREKPSSTSAGYPTCSTISTTASTLASTKAAPTCHPGSANGACSAGPCVPERGSCCSTKPDANLDAAIAGILDTSPARHEGSALIVTHRVDRVQAADEVWHFAAGQ